MLYKLLGWKDRVNKPDDMILLSNKPKGLEKKKPTNPRCEESTVKTTTCSWITTKISIDKMKHQPTIKINNAEIENVAHFEYLHSIIINNRSCYKKPEGD